MKTNDTARFLKSRKSIKCLNCEDSYFNKSIHIYLKTPFNEETGSLIVWEHVGEEFRLLNNMFNRSPNGHTILHDDPIIKTLHDVKAQCSTLSKLGYKIASVSFSRTCPTCPFIHAIYKIWNDVSLLDSSDVVQTDNFTLHRSYIRNSSKIMYPDGSGKTIPYTFDYILNVNIFDYNTLQSQIQKILLLR